MPMIRAILVTATMLMARPAVPCALPSVEAQAGASIYERTTGGTAAAAAIAVTTGWSLRPCTELPVRLEASLFTTTRGPPWGQGGESVRVSAFELGLWALAGLSWPLLESSQADKSQQLGAELLAGPQLQMTRVGTTVLSRSAVAWEVRGLARLVGGVFYAYRAWRFTTRATWSYPRGSGVGLLAGVGVNI